MFLKPAVSKAPPANDSRSHQSNFSIFWRDAVLMQFPTECDPNVCIDQVKMIMSDAFAKWCPPLKREYRTEDLRRNGRETRIGAPTIIRLEIGGSCLSRG